MQITYGPPPITNTTMMTVGHDGIGGFADSAGIMLSMAGAAAGAYHGYKRNGSVGWAIGWAMLGSIFPLITGGVAVAQGFGKPKRR